MMNDEILDEVRAIREARAAACHLDLQAIAADLLRTEREWAWAEGPATTTAAEHPAENLACRYTAR